MNDAELLLGVVLLRSARGPAAPLRRPTAAVAKTSPRYLDMAVCASKSRCRRDG